MSKSGAPIENINAEKWSLEEATKLYNKALLMSEHKDDYIIGTGQNAIKVKGFQYHFIGELACDLETYSDLFLYLKKKYPELEHKYKRLKGRLESNCFSDSKKGIIKEATAIMNLKSNYKWTDRVENNIQDNRIILKDID